MNSTSPHAETQESLLAPPFQWFPQHHHPQVPSVSQPTDFWNLVPLSSHCSTLHQGPAISPLTWAAACWFPIPPFHLSAPPPHVFDASWSIFVCSKADHISLLHEALHWLPVAARIKTDLLKWPGRPLWHGLHLSLQSHVAQYPLCHLPPTPGSLHLLCPHPERCYHQPPTLQPSPSGQPQSPFLSQSKHSFLSLGQIPQLGDFLDLHCYPSELVSHYIIIQTLYCIIIHSFV